MDLIKSHDLMDRFSTTLDKIEAIVELLPSKIGESLTSFFNYHQYCYQNNIPLSEEDFYQIEKFIFEAMEGCIVVYGRAYVQFENLKQEHPDLVDCYIKKINYEWLVPNLIFDIFNETNEALLFLYELKHFINISIIKSRVEGFYDKRPKDAKVVSIDFSKRR